jgi:hypothetical protein
MQHWVVVYELRAEVLPWKWANALVINPLVTAAELRS